MNLYALRLFYHVAKKGSVTRAAEDLRISQPAVTGQIRNLETELELQLLAPKGRGIVLTEAGEMLAAQAERLFSLEAEMGQMVNTYKQGKLGKITIAATYMPANFLLPGWLASFQKQNRRIEVSLITCNAKTAIEHLLQYKADVAVIGGGEMLSDTNREELYEDEFVFIVPKDHKFAQREVTLEELLKEPFVLREEGSSTREQLLALCNAQRVSMPLAAILCNGLHETIRAVMAGYGAALVSAMEASESIQRHDVAQVTVSHLCLKNPVTLHTRKQDTLTPAAQKAVSHLIQMRNSGP
ncbi:LysR family transcriptional regulator [Brevibacillus fluminis]|uniref:LysR family transcriptional regulator n=1 Tax=Brevibacillus fluminis TaxID=511487 RepID=A0A3M8DUG4_9BACL|nr:LysR substrate-binding domain-containing protein [Brevibacillus fluminis]RNB91818.1 LysR family transcriptional regulator [Brevibacillus fluminis]